MCTLTTKTTTVNIIYTFIELTLELWYTKKLFSKKHEILILVIFTNMIYFTYMIILLFDGS